MKSELVIVKGQEFKISVQDTIKEDDIFIEQYKQAADMLNAILSENQDSDKNKNNTIHLWQQTEYENNIIAFCGDRGDGKSSAMLTFINALCCKDDHKEDDEIDLFKNRIDKKTYIAEPIVIDPSQFDDVHNVLDIVLAKMYKNFNDKYQKDNRESDESKALDLLKRFQKVYRQIAMIYDQQKILDKEFDYEGNIDKLAKLGESTNLKSDFENLIIQYLEFMNNKAEISKSQLLIAIDDLDLCNQVAYKLAEQLRKYLIIPHVVIVMAVKNDQLQLAMQEKNINEYKAVIQYTGKFDNKETSNELDFEIKNMAERYVSKLIPKARRIYMPKMRNISETKISYKEKVDDKEKIIWDSNEDTLVKSVLELIHEKTGMIFLEEDTGMSYLVPDNLRDLINWISQLTKMKSVEKKRKNRNKDEEESEMEDNNLEKDGKLIEKIKKENIDKFYEIFISDWVDRELPWGWKKRFNTLEGMDVIHINANVKKMIEPLFDWDEINKAQFEQMFRWHGGERAVEFFEIMYYFENFNNNIFDIEREKILSQNCNSNETKKENLKDVVQDFANQAVNFGKNISNKVMKNLNLDALKDFSENIDADILNADIENMIDNANDYLDQVKDELEDLIDELSDLEEEIEELEEEAEDNQDELSEYKEKMKNKKAEILLKLEKFKNRFNQE